MKIFTRLFLLISVCISNTLIAQPTANFTANPLSGCAPLWVQFTSTSTGNPTSYLWNLGNGVTSVLQNPSTTYTIPGTYTVTLTVSNANGSNTKTVTNYIEVLGGPVVSFTANDTAACPPMTVLFTNGSNPVTPGPATYYWNFGDGNSSTQQHPSHVYSTPGYYHVTLSVTNSSNCVTSLTMPNYIHVYAPPITNFTGSPSTYCDAPANVSFSPSIIGNGPYIYSWNFGDGGTSAGSSPMHTYALPGSYTVTLIVTDINGCKDTIVKTNYISIGATTPAFTVSQGCANTPLQFTNNSVNATTVLWDFGDGNTSAAMNPTHTYTLGGTYNVKLVIYNSPCADSITIPVTVSPAPALNFNYTPPLPCPAPVSIQFNNASTGASSYSWTFGDGGTSTLNSPAHTYTSSGEYPVRLTGTSGSGCVSTREDTVRIYDLVLYPLPESVGGCIPFTTNFQCRVDSLVLPFPPFYDPAFYTGTYPYPVISWFWDFGDGGTSTLPTPSHTYTTIGNHTVTLTVTTSNGCTVTQAINVSSGLKPTAAFTISDDSICVNAADTFTSYSTGPTPLQLIWDFGEGTSSGSTSLNPAIHEYSVSNTYDITLIASHYGCNDTLVKPDSVTVLPPTSFYSPVFHCDSPLVVTFDDNFSIGVTSRFWDFGDGATDTAAYPTHTYPSLGSYFVTLITYNDVYGCVDTAATPVTLINPLLTFSTPDTAICKGDSIVFTPSYYPMLVPAPYYWSINGMATDTSVGPWGYRFNQNGVYTISVCTQDENGCWDTATRTGYILVAKPDAGFTGTPVLGCTPLSVTFTDTSTNTPGAYSVTRVWDYGNGNTATVNTASSSNVYSVAGLYNVQMIVTDNVGCSDTLMKNNYVDAREPVAAFTASDNNVCIGELIAFSNNSSGTSLNAYWDFGDGTTSTAYSPTKSYSQTGSYDVRLIVTDPISCSDSMLQVACINVSKPTAVFSMNDSIAICPPLNILFTNTSIGALSYAWSFGNSGTSTVQNPTATYTIPGIYNIMLVATNMEGCTDTAYGQANLLGYAGGLTYTPLTGCVPLEVQFVANLKNVPSILWDFSDGVTMPLSGGDTISHIYTTPGAYVPKLILSDSTGCQNSSVGLDTIKVDAVLAGFITSPPCVNAPVTFTDTSFSYFSPVTAWNWSFNNGQQTANSSNPVIIYNAAGTYPVTLIATNAQGCEDTMNTTITIYELPVISAGVDTSICSGDAAHLAGIGGISYTWSPPASLSCSNCPDPYASPAGPTSYVVTGTDAHGCVNTDTVKVNIQFITTSIVNNGGEVCEDSSFQLLASGAQKYEWKPAESLNNPSIPNPLASPETTTIYTVLAWEGSCPPDSHTVRVVVFPKPVVDAGADQTIVAGASIMLNATGSNLASFIWSPAITLSCEHCSNPVATPTVTTMYKVVATSDFGCRNYDTVTIHILCDNSQVFIPNTFTPNRDGQNDVFFPRGEGLKSITSFRVYNRWGEVMFEKNGLQLNDASAGWDGTYKGRELAPDIFVYVIDGICDTGEPLSWKGDVSLIR